MAKTILILANSDAGLYHFRKELTEKLVQEYELHLGLPYGEYIPFFEQLGCVCHNITLERHGKNPLMEIKLLQEYKRLIKEVAPIMVFTYTIKPNVYGGMVCSKLHIPYVANVTGLGTAIVNGGIMQKITLFLYRKGLKNAQKVFFQNSANREFMIDKKVVKGSFELLPGSGVNTKQHCYEPYPEETEDIHFLFIGRIMRDKGIRELLQATRIVKKKYPKIQVELVGGYDDCFKNEMEEAVQEGIICYHGRQEDVHPFIKAAHCCVLPSYHEGMSNVMLESASTGRPVIATNIPGCRETFEEGITGLGCEPKDAESLAKAMLTFIELPYEKKREMGIKGRQKMEREFDRTLVIDVYINEIKKCEEKLNI